ncbi:MAG: hypothetical protein NVS3B12_09340 [Acidimicrobiales bacterium]
MSTVAVGVLWLPWLQTGTTRRSAFRLVSALRGAGLMTRTPAELFLVAVGLIPGLAAAAWLLWATGYRRVSGLATASVGALTLACAVGVNHVGRARVTPNVTIAAMVGVIAVLAAVVPFRNSLVDGEVAA